MINICVATSSLYPSLNIFVNLDSVSTLNVCVAMSSLYPSLTIHVFVNLGILYLRLMYALL